MAAWRARPRSVLFLASNCRDMSGRLAFVEALSKLVRVDSPGRCLNNVAWTDLVLGGRSNHAARWAGLNKPRDGRAGRANVH